MSVKGTIPVASRTAQLTPTTPTGLSFFEFFAGGGMARAGLGPAWSCAYANDFDLKKGAAYRANWGGDEIRVKDIRKVSLTELPGTPTLVWASFPCQDLSLAGMGAGLKGDRSGTFWPFWKIVDGLRKDGRGPRLVVLENVCGTLTSHDGRDFAAISDALSRSGYRFGAIVVDAAMFVPQSRPRLFIVAVSGDVRIPKSLTAGSPLDPWHTKALKAAHEGLGASTKKNWIWWRLPLPEPRKQTLAQILENEPQDVRWHTPAETATLIGMMSGVNLKKLEAAKHSGKTVVGTVYKRTRFDTAGTKVQRAEIRFDGLAGCLRTSSGGSSRQLIVVVKGANVRSRLLSAREAARLMGLDDNYVLPKNYNEAYHLLGDGLVVKAVNFLANNLLRPLAPHGVKASTKVA